MIKKQWTRYAETWSLPEEERLSRLQQLITADVTYTDPTTSLGGLEALSNYMGKFQLDAPGGRFVITEAYEHHGQSLAYWQMLNEEGMVMMNGTSYALLSDEGKFQSLTGFFRTADG